MDSWLVWVIVAVIVLALTVTFGLCKMKFGHGCASGGSYSHHGSTDDPNHISDQYVVKNPKATNKSCFS